MSGVRGNALSLSLARSSSWRVGGCATRYFRPADLEDLQCYLKITMWFGDCLAWSW